MAEHRCARSSRAPDARPLPGGAGDGGDRRLHDARRALSTSSGIEPGQALQELYRIDPAPGGRAPAGRARRRRRRPLPTSLRALLAGRLVIVLGSGIDGAAPGGRLPARPRSRRTWRTCSATRRGPARPRRGSRTSWPLTTASGRSTTSCTGSTAASSSRGPCTARSPARRAAAGARAPPPLLVTSSYDRTLERALAEAGEEIDVVSYRRPRPRPRQVPPRRPGRRGERDRRAERRDRPRARPRTVRAQDPRRRRRARTASGRASWSARTTTSTTWPRPTSRRRSPSRSPRGSAQPLPVPRLRARGVEPARVPAAALGRERSLPLLGGRARARELSRSSGDKRHGRLRRAARRVSRPSSSELVERGRRDDDRATVWRRTRGSRRSTTPSSTRCSSSAANESAGDRGEPGRLAADRPVRAEPGVGKSSVLRAGVAHDLRWPGGAWGRGGRSSRSSSSTRGATTRSGRSARASRGHACPRRDRGRAGGSRCTVELAVAAAARRRPLRPARPDRGVLRLPRRRGGRRSPTSSPTWSRARAAAQLPARDPRGRAREARRVQGRGSRTCSATTCGSTIWTRDAGRAAIVGPVEPVQRLVGGRGGRRGRAGARRGRPRPGGRRQGRGRAARDAGGRRRGRARAGSRRRTSSS